MFSALPPDQYRFQPELLRVLPLRAVPLPRGLAVEAGAGARAPRPSDGPFTATVKLPEGPKSLWGMGLLIAVLYFLLNVLLESLPLLPFRLPRTPLFWLWPTFPIRIAIEENDPCDSCCP